MTEHPVIVLGAGGHAKVIVSTLKALGLEILGIADPDEILHGREILGVSIIGDDDAAMGYGADAVAMVNAIGSIHSTDLRRTVFERFRDAGYGFRTVIHPSAVIGEGTELGDGAQVMAGAVIQPDCSIGADTIVNTRAVVDHDCAVGDHAHIAPGAVLGGNVQIGDGAHVGSSATVIQNINIGAGCLVAAGAVVVSDVADGIRVSGVPARPMDGAQT